MASPDIKVHRECLGSLPNAIRAGRERIQTPYFAFLDDDDEYLPNALHSRMEALGQHPQAALLATNGYRVNGAHQTLMLAKPPGEDLLRSLEAGNWLASCGGLYRTALANPDLFEPDFHYLEWTYIAYKLALRSQAVYLNQPTFRVHETPVSLSRNDGYHFGVLQALQRMMLLPLPTDVRHVLSQRVGSAHHACAEICARRGELGRAWQHHLLSLAKRKGLRYLSYTRKLLVPGFKRTGG